MSARLLRQCVVICGVAVAATAMSESLPSAQRFSDWSEPANLGGMINTASFEG